MTSTLKILEILEAAQIEQPRAKAIAAAIEHAISDHDGDLKEWLEEQHKPFATKEDFAKLEIKLEAFKAEMIKWMFLFCVGQTAVLAGFIKLLSSLDR